MPKKKVEAEAVPQAPPPPVKATHEQVIIVYMNKVMADVGYVHKKDENKFQKYKYAGEAALLATLRPAMVKHGLVLLPSIQKVSPIDEYGNTHVIIDYTLTHISGAVWPHPLSAAGCGNDRNSKGGVGDKGLYKAITGANKYMLFKLFQLETGDDAEKADKEDSKAKASDMEKVMAYIRSIHQSASEEDRKARMELLHHMLAQKGFDAVESHTHVTGDQWSQLLTLVRELQNV
tara:strand:+ start:1125 stop:1823 length:699 start_codon:yes stop_codon:yes gene_type:complete